MKKKIAIFSSIGAVLLLVGSYVFFTSSMGKPKVSSPEGHYTTDQLHFLQQVGLGNAKNLDLHEDYDAFTNPELFHKYEKMGLRYFSKEGLDKFCKTFNIIYGMTKDFTGEIPSKNIDELSVNLKRITPAKEYSVYYFNHDLDPKPILGYVEPGNVRPEAERIIDEDRTVAWLGGLVYKDTYSAQYGGSSLILHKAKVSGTVEHPQVIMICAPEYMFNTTGKDIVDNQLVEHKKVDPMIIAVTPDGYVVLTAWAN